MLIPALEPLLARSTYGPLLVQVLDIEAAAALVSAQGAGGAGLKGLVLGPSSTLGVKMLPEIIVWRLQLFYYVCCTTASALECHIAVSLVHVIDVVLVLHGLSIVLVLKYFSQYAFGTCGHARVVDGAVASVLNAHSSSMNGIELVLHSCTPWRPLSASSAGIVASLSH